MVRTFQKHSGLEKYEGRSLDLALDRTPVKESGVKSARRRAAVRTACSLRVLASSVLGFLMLLDMELLELELLEDKVTREEDIKLLQQMSLVGLAEVVDDIVVVEHRSSRIHPSPMGLFEHHTDNCHHIYMYTSTGWQPARPRRAVCAPHPAGRPMQPPCHIPLICTPNLKMH